MSPAYHLPKGGTATTQRRVPCVDANTPGTLRKLDLFGKSTDKKLFEYPANLDSLIETGEQLKLADHVLQGVTCGIYDAVGSIKLHFGNGEETPQFGTETGQQLKCSLEVPHGENVTRIKVRHKASPASIQNITFETDTGTEIEFNGKLSDGTWSEIALEPGEIIVGCYGCCWSEKQPEIVGLGFVIWRPLS